MTVYTATLGGYSFGCDQEWDWVDGLPSGIGPGEYRGGRIPVTGQHGEFPSGADFASSGRLVFELEHASGDAAEVELAAKRLRSAFAPWPSDGQTELTVELASDTYVVFGRPMSPLVDLSRGHFGYGRARVVFEALDPLWYGATPQQVTVQAGGSSGGMDTPMVTPMVTTGSGSSGDAPVVNSGTAPAHWTASLSGGTAGVTTPRLILGGQLIQIDGTIPAGSVLTIDSRDHGVRLDGQPRAWAAFSSMWWLIPPGQSTFSYRAVTGDGLASLTWLHASF